MITAVFAADGDSVLTSSGDGIARLWNWRTGARHDLTGHSRTVTSATMTPDRRFIATSSEDGTVRLWDARTAESLATLWVSEDAVWSVAFSRDGRWLTTAGEDGTVRVHPCRACGTPADLVREADRRRERRLSREERRRFLHER